MDRENRATIAPQIVMCSTQMPRMIIKQRVVFCVEAQGGSVYVDERRFQHSNHETII